MTQSLSIAGKTLELTPPKKSGVEQSSTPTPIVRLQRRLSDLFWAYTEDTGKADTSSYKGLL